MAQERKTRKSTKASATAERTGTDRAADSSDLEQFAEDVTDQLDRAARTAGDLVAARRGAEGLTGDVAAVGEPAADSNVTDELSGGGVAFGDFVKSVGLAVAAAQSELDKTLQDTAKALSETQIDVIAVFEQVVKDEDGSMDKGVIHNQKLPLINYLMPTAYHWSRVYLEADMQVKEFNSRSGFNIQQKAASASVGASTHGSLFGAGFSGSASASASASSTSADSSYGTDTAAGSLHMEATLEPRTDIQLPKPFILQKGPTLTLMVGAKTELKQDANDPNKVTGYQAEVTASLSKTDGSPAVTKTLATTLSDPALSFTAEGKTDANGEMKITVTRRVVDPKTDKPVQALVRVSFGLVTQTTGIAL